ncbi:ERP1 [Giardia lamblia P15]|uniref:ERP1 n=1 Tax=Giardia intestinalis (strain P15) TaxID=658858 RepID=E1F0J1_GIAIA|nr:ERP1 [Giardia lamblia P15]
MFLLFILWLPVVVYSVETMIAQGERLCFVEELPTGVKLQGSYGAKSPVEFPVSVTILSPNGTLYRSDDIPEEARFSFSVTVSGTYQLCFIGQVRREGQRSRYISINLDVGSVFGSSSTSDTDANKYPLIESIVSDMKEVKEDFSYMKHRELFLRARIKKLATSVMMVSTLCVLVSWAGMILIGQWTRISIRKHM